MYYRTSYIFSLALATSKYTFMHWTSWPNIPASFRLLFYALLTSLTCHRIEQTRTLPTICLRLKEYFGCFIFVIQFHIHTKLVFVFLLVLCSELAFSCDFFLFTYVTDFYILMPNKVISFLIFTHIILLKALSIYCI